ncbi:MAG: FtsK/SpoIIIE domain-containing protein [Phycisphaerales bacterium]|jgi:hypothetical protein|nr:FtsK/SpoIIIE domain-containing protein [Phycisphaerales bacterium]
MNETQDSSLVGIALRYVEQVVSMFSRAASGMNDIESAYETETQANDSNRHNRTKALKKRVKSATRECEETRTRRTEQAIETSTRDLETLAESTERRRLGILDSSERHQTRVAKSAEGKRWMAESLYEVEHMKAAEAVRLAQVTLDSANHRASRLGAADPADSDPEAEILEIDQIEELLSTAEHMRDATIRSGWATWLARLKLAGWVLIPPAVAWLVCSRIEGASALLWTGLAALAGVLIAAATALRSTLHMRALNHQAAELAGQAVAAAAARLDATQQLLKDQERSARESRNTRLEEVRTAVSDMLDQAAPETRDDLQKLADHAKRREKLIREERERFLQQVETRHRETLEKIEEDRTSESAAIESEFSQRKEAAERAHQEGWSDLASTWARSAAGLQSLRAASSDAEAQTVRPVTSETWREAPLASAPCPEIPLGHIRVTAADIPPGPPNDPRLPWTEPDHVDLPVGLHIESAHYIRIDCPAAHRAVGVQMLQSLLFGAVVSLPPSMIKLMLADPVGLGETFASFMHLADFENAAVSRVWSETRHIEEQLAKRTEHMERVIQTYLRDEFESLAHYNRHAAAIAEQYQAVVMADYPAGINAAAAKRLESILSSGGRCGVIAMVMRDTDREIPDHLESADRIDPDIGLKFDGERWELVNPPLKDFPYTPPPATPPEAMAGMLQRVGEAAADGQRVEVPFEVIAPSPEARWTRGTETELRVALGQTGANRFLEMTLGRGTTQHALLAGRTGSGKSTLLHVLITNLALWYSPDEIEFHMVDFKKGVEFQTYANHHLPHARVIAIESDREFGVSVLQKLDRELRHRGDLFREAGVQDLAGWRAKSDQRMPRILLVVDEFQEFFVDDDQIAQEAGLLLDRLVRQGRAFGMHVLMGSQTLDGAFSLARSTLGQMGVRIALQCTEADSYLILSDDNPAARMLRRPGDAIYNDAGGKLEGNTPFQVVWLADAERDTILEGLQTLDHQRFPNADRPQFVFRGNVPSLLSSDEAIQERLAAPPAATDTIPLLLGDPIAITAKTHITLRAQSGSNALLVGQHAEAANALMIAALLQAAAELPATDTPDAEGLMVWILDGAPPDALFAGQLAMFGDQLPHQVTRVTAQNVQPELQRLTDILESRAGGGRGTGAHILILGLEPGRIPALRPADDDFSFSMDDDAAAKPDRQLAALLRDGPVAGIHSLLWYDGLNNVNRGLSRASQREFHARVLFQMGANDSGQLIDATTAADLGPHRALLHLDAFGTIEKFRPWGMPDAEWLEAAAARLRAR